MHVQTARRAAWAAVGLHIVVTALGLSLVVLNRETLLPPGVSSVVSDASLLVAFLPYGVIGALILSRRPGNRIGSLFLISGLGIVVGITTFEYAIYAGLTRGGSLPGVEWAIRASQGLALVPFLAIMFLFLLFPDGHLPSRRWLPVAFLALLSAGWLEANSIVPSFPLEPARELMAVALLLCALAPLIRYRGSDSVERQQIKWFAFAAFPAVGFLIPGLFVNASGLFFVPFVVAMAAVPFGAAIAIFKYRLYDIDAIIDRTIVYGGLAAFITAVYVIVVSVIGAFVGATQVLSLVATAIVAVAFQPVRLRVEGIARRFVYGERATPYETLSTFSEHLSETYSVDEVLPSMARILAQGTGASRADVWLRVGSELRLAASWPHGDDRTTSVPIHDGTHPPIVTASRVEAASRESDVRHRGDLLGALVVTKPPFERFSPAEEKLVSDLSSQAGLVLRNVALIEDLRASRQRLVSAQDDERRRIERNIHDGAQQQLVALAVKMRLIEGMTREAFPKAADLAHQVVEETGEALESLRELAHGIYPPLLADQGLAVALESHARKAPLPVTIDADRLGRYGQDIEAAIYFCCLEALQNVALIGDLRASRQRLVSAQDDERRRIERNIHDGAQQQLVALAVKMRLIEGMTREAFPKAADLAHQVVEETGEALESLREPAQGIYPPLLADQGLAVALESHARKAPLPVTIDADRLGRYGQDIEAAIYFCCLEALQNVAKYAAASKATIEFDEGDGWLGFAVADDGAGFRTDEVPLGSGLQGMKDRLEALGGGLEVRSQPGVGTTVSGRVPAPSLSANPGR